MSTISSAATAAAKQKAKAQSGQNLRRAEKKKKKKKKKKREREEVDFGEGEGESAAHLQSDKAFGAPSQESANTETSHQQLAFTSPLPLLTDNLSVDKTRVDIQLISPNHDQVKRDTTITSLWSSHQYDPFL
jgi:hypothetical protein